MAGRPQGSRDAKPWSDAIRLAAFRREKKGEPRALQLAATKLFRVAIAGDVSALKEIGDRLDGKPTQAIDIQADIRNVVEIKVVIVEALPKSGEVLDLEPIREAIPQRAGPSEAD